MPKRSKIDGGYIVIPKRTVKSHDWRRLKATSRVVFITMLTEFYRSRKENPQNRVKITQGQIEEMSGLAHSTVSRAIKELKEIGYISVLIQGHLGKQSEYSIETSLLY